MWTCLIVLLVITYIPVHTCRAFFTHRKCILCGAPHASVHRPSAMRGMIPENMYWLVRLYPLLYRDSIAWRQSRIHIPDYIPCTQSIAQGKCAWEPRSHHNKKRYLKTNKLYLSTEASAATRKRQYAPGTFCMRKSTMITWLRIVFSFSKTSAGTVLST